MEFPRRTELVRFFQLKEWITDYSFDSHPAMVNSGVVHDEDTCFCELDLPGAISCQPEDLLSGTHGLLSKQRIYYPNPICNIQTQEFLSKPRIHHPPMIATLLRVLAIPSSNKVSRCTMHIAFLDNVYLTIVISQKIS